MKLTIERTGLLKTLGNVQKVVERRTTIPILANVKLAAQGEHLSLTATDMDLTVQADCPAQIEQSGATTVSAHTLFDIVRKLPEGSMVSLEQAPGTSEIQLAAGRSQFTLPTLPADEYPAMETEELDLRFTIPVDDLKKLIDKTRFAISTEETRYYLNGIHIHALANDGAASVLRGVATDGHRLSRVEIAMPDGAGSIPPIIVPRKTVQELRSIIEEVSGEITIGVSPKRIQFLLDGTILLSRLIDGTFPDYERVIPANNDKTAFVDAKPLAETVDRVSTIATERARAIKLGFQNGGIVVSAVSSEAGRAVEEIDSRYDGETLEIGFNARYMLDILGEIEGDEVQIDLNNPAAPTLLRDPGDSSTLYVLMPMRV